MLAIILHKRHVGEGYGGREDGRAGGRGCTVYIITCACLILLLYKSKPDDYLSKICIPTGCLNCKDMLCKCITQVNSIQKLHDDIVSACIDASQVTHSTSKKTSKTIPGWDSSVSYKRERALFWKSSWHCMNCPRDGNVADIMRRTTTQYHYAIRKLKSNNELLR